MALAASCAEATLHNLPPENLFNPLPSPPQKPLPVTLTGRLYRARMMLGHHYGALAIAVLLAFAGWLPVPAPFALVPGLVKATGRVLLWGQRPVILRLGVSEIFHSVVFGLLVVGAYS